MSWTPSYTLLFLEGSAGLILRDPGAHIRSLRRIMTCPRQREILIECFLAHELVDLAAGSLLVRPSSELGSDAHPLEALSMFVCIFKTAFSTCIYFFSILSSLPISLQEELTEHPGHRRVRRKYRILQRLMTELLSNSTAGGRFRRSKEDARLWFTFANTVEFHRRSTSRHGNICRCR